MANDVVHFAVHADDCQRAKRFYEGVFGWTFEPWGPPEFWLIHTSGSGILGALEPRQAPVAGAGMIGYQCTISVTDLASIADAIENHGGTVTMPATTIDTVGTVLVFNDTEGNVVGAMQYDEGIMDRLKRPASVAP